MTAHAVTAGHDEDAAAARSNMLLAVKLAILSEIMLFGALFAAYFVIRGESAGWPPPGHLERPELLLPGLNSLLLIASSVTMQLAVRGARVGSRTRILRWLGLTLLLGGVFLLVQGYEFSSNGFGLDAGVFGSTFYILTGFHGAHVLAGLVLIAIVANRARLGLVSAERHTALEGTSYYWHFVDVVWLFLFSTLYVL
ncbi:MAG: cytochrome c oxidase subunit [Chloroflexota bacterium]|jgi:cytochrome c oxidase subunit 3|nr:cytochrome c oxidase subunit [Chloroflexota bacterium]